MNNLRIYTLNRLKKVFSVWLLLPASFKLARIGMFDKHNRKQKMILALIYHLGDNVACEPIERYLRKENPNSFIIRVTGKENEEILRFNPNFEKVVTVSSLAEWIYLKWLLKFFYKIVDLHLDGGFCSKYRLPLRNKNFNSITFQNYYEHGSLLEAFSLAAHLPKINEKPIIYLPPNLTIGGLPELFAVIHTTSNVDQRNWTEAKWSQLVNYIMYEKKLAVVEIGFKNTVHSTSHLYYDRCGKLSLLNIATLIKRAILFIGIDSSFAHFANAMNTNKLVLLGYWNNFKSYNPYSGMTAEDIERELVYHDGPVKDLPLEKVISKLELGYKAI